MARFNSLEKALDSWFGHSLDELPNPLKRRVINDFWMVKWDLLTPDQRRSFAQQHDYQHDPATEDHQEYWFNFYADMHDLERKVEEWERVATPTALDLKQKESELKSLREEIAHRLRLKKMLLERRFPRIMSDFELDSDEVDEDDYYAFVAALERLKKRLNATIEEIAAWVFMGPDEGGLRAFTNPWHSSSVSRFWFQPHMEANYEALLFNCWFLKEEIENFIPRERFISGKALVKRWQGAIGERAKDFIRAKVIDGDLTDLHPVKGATEATASEFDDFPDLETGLFSLDEIHGVEHKQGIEISDDALFREKVDHESPTQRRERLEQWLDIEKQLGGERGAIQRVAEREGVTRQRINQILKKTSG